MKCWIVEWVDEWGLLKRKEFTSQKEADKFADEIFEFYPVRIYRS